VLHFSTPCCVFQTPPTQTPPGQQSEEDEPDSSSYTGMATALANAIRERRQHISDKSEEGLGVDGEGDIGTCRYREDGGMGGGGRRWGGRR
jgi:hypothetical protein